MDIKNTHLKNRIYVTLMVTRFSKIAKAVYEQNCAVFLQIHHAGILGICQYPVCPDNYSYMQENVIMKIDKRMTIEGIQCKNLIMKLFIDYK